MTAGPPSAEVNTLDGDPVTDRRVEVRTTRTGADAVREAFDALPG